MLKSVGNSLRRNPIFAWPQSISPKAFTNHKEKSSNFTVKKAGKHHLNQVTKFNITLTITCTLEI